MNKVVLISAFSVLMIASCKQKDPEAFAFGNFESDEIVVSAESTGKLFDFKVDEGMKVDSGQYCGYVDTTQQYLKKLQLRNGINTVKTKYIQLEKQLAVNYVSMKNIKREQARLDSMFMGGAATSKQIDDLSGQADLLEAQISALNSQKATLDAEKESLEIQISQVNDLISKSVIYSPVKGTVLEKYLFRGELATTGKPLFKIADLSELVLRVYISGNQLEAIKLGSEVRVFADSANNALREFRGVVAWISSKSEFTPKIIQTRDERVNLVYAVKVRVPNDGSLKIGMPGEIRPLN
jgi:HlyD family secretion protein